MEEQISSSVVREETQLQTLIQTKETKRQGTVRVNYHLLHLLIHVKSILLYRNAYLLLEMVTEMMKMTEHKHYFPLG
jgi:predicted nucleotidyltransferase